MLGFSFELNLAVVSIAVMLCGCLRASNGLQLINFCFVVSSLKLLKSVEMVCKIFLYAKFG